MAQKKIVPVNCQVLIRRLKPETQSKIELPDSYKNSAFAIGEVLAVGPGSDVDKPPCKAEDVILFWLPKDEAENNPAALIQGYGDCAMVSFDHVYAVIE